MDTKRRTDMRNRAAALAAVSAFAIAVAGIAVAAARSGGGSALERLPVAGVGVEGDAVMSLASPGGAGGGVELTVEGTLPDLPDEAPAFRLRAEGARAAAARVAEAFDLEGPVEDDNGSFSVGGRDRRAVVESAPGLPWYLTGQSCSRSVDAEPARGCVLHDDDAPHAVGSVTVGSASSSASVQACPPCPPEADCTSCPPNPVATRLPARPARPADLPTRDEAERLARGAFGKLGVPLDGLRLEGGEHSWEAVVRVSVGGLPTVGLEHRLSIGSKGEVTAAHGYLGGTDRIGEYPLAGTQVGLERLRQGRGRSAQPIEDRDGAEPPRVAITGAHLALEHVEDVLVPVYVFELRHGGELAVPAVTDRWLKEQQQPGPPGQGRQERRDREIGHGSGACTKALGVAGEAQGEEDGSDPKNQPLVVQVCVEPARAEVGQEVVFTVTATDPDAQITPAACGEVVTFGDEEGAVTGDCIAACAAPGRFAPKPRPEAGEHSATYSHAYAKAGRYTARFAFRSTMCSPYGSRGEAEVEVVVGD